MIGQKLDNRYTITFLLGEGAMGKVYLATDEQTGQQVALKILARQLIGLSACIVSGWRMGCVSIYLNE